MTEMGMIGKVSISKDTTAAAATPGVTTNRDMARMVITGAAIMLTATTETGCIGLITPMEREVHST